MALAFATGLKSFISLKSQKGCVKMDYEREVSSGKADGLHIGVGVAGPVDEVVVMEVHENGHRLPQEDAGPHDHVPNLPPGKRQGCNHPQWNLKGE